MVMVLSYGMLLCYYSMIIVIILGTNYVVLILWFLLSIFPSPHMLRAMLFVYPKKVNIPIPFLYFFFLHQSFYSFHFLLQFYFLPSLSVCLRYPPPKGFKNHISMLLPLVISIFFFFYHVYSSSYRETGGVWRGLEAYGDKIFIL